MAENIYYFPEEHDLEVVMDFDWGGDYEFDMLVVWRNDNGTFYWAEDAGCSCPSPFEDYTAKNQLHRISKNGNKAFENLCNQIRERNAYAGEYGHKYSAAELNEAIGKLKRAFNQKE